MKIFKTVGLLVLLVIAHRLSAGVFQSSRDHHRDLYT